MRFIRTDRAGRTQASRSSPTIPCARTVCGGRTSASSAALSGAPPGPSRTDSRATLGPATGPTPRPSPRAPLPKPLPLAEYLEARPIAEPLRLFDCVMPCAGAEGFLVLTVERARQPGLPYARILGA